MLGCVSEQASERHNRRQNSEVEKNKRSHALDTEAIFEIRRIKRGFPFDVVDESSKQPKRVQFEVQNVIKI